MSAPISRVGRSCARPPHTGRWPRQVRLSRFRWATPTRAAVCWRLRVSSTSRWATHVIERMGPTPGTLCNRSSLARHPALERMRCPTSVSKSDNSCSSHWKGAWCRGRRPAGAALSRSFSVVSSSMGWRQHVGSALSSCTWGSSSNRGVGRTAPAQCASARAVNASVLAKRPVALAKSLAWRGGTTATCKPVVARATVTSNSKPPVASRTINAGSTPHKRTTRLAMPSASSLETVHPCSVGRRAISYSDVKTSIPTTLAVSDIIRPWMARPCVMRAHMALATVRALGEKNMTPCALLPPPPTRGTAVHHARTTYHHHATSQSDSLATKLTIQWTGHRWSAIRFAHPSPSHPWLCQAVSGSHQRPDCGSLRPLMESSFAPALKA
jgi:hypothetical protein